MTSSRLEARGTIYKYEYWESWEPGRHGLHSDWVSRIQSRLCDKAFMTNPAQRRIV